MKNETVYAKKFVSLFKRIKQEIGDVASADAPDPIGQLVLGFLQWEATGRVARTAYEHLMERMVDHNDLRVSHPQEIKVLIGQRYPKAEARVGHLLTALQEIYIRQYAVSLDGLAKKPKKEIRAYLDSLPGMSPYVAAQVTLLCFGGHAIPVDQVLVSLLRKEGAIDPEASVQEVEAFLERRIRASDAVAAHAVLRTWADAGYQTVSGSSKQPKKSKTGTIKTKKVAASVTKKVAKKTSKRVVKK